MTDGSPAAFAESFWDEIRDRMDDDPELMDRDAFVHIATEHLIEDGVLEDLEVCYHKAPASRGYMEVAGYGVSSGGTTLDLATAVIGLHGNTLTKDVLRRRIRQAEVFAESCRDGIHSAMEPSSPVYDMAQHIHASWPKLEKIRVFLFTDGRLTVDRSEGGEVGEVPVTHELWDVTRIHRLASSGRQEGEIVVDLTGYDQAVECMQAPDNDSGYDCLLALVPGALLAQIYEEHGSRLLQRNVRAFLQARGKVNKGINATVRQEPKRFLAYNNGISATATSVATEAGVRGTRITGITDLQIVNGGQTTASLHYAWKRGESDLADVMVPAKITVVRGELLEDLVPRISRYANSQNVIREADFEANSPFHVEIERLSRSVWAPPPDGGTRQTRWYYERVRGQYQVDVARQGTTARKRTFKQENPTAQRFSKTDAAKYEMAYLGHPHVVSLGAEKCFQHWTLEVVGKREEPPDVTYFRSLVAKALLFEESRKVIRRLELGGGGYLAQTTSYVLALLVLRAGEQLDLDRVWREQALPPEVVRAVTELVSVVRPVLVSPPNSGNVTEWCKKEDCWKRVQDVSWELSERMS